MPEFLRFRLWHLFAGITILAMVLAVYLWRVEQQRSAVATIRAAGGYVSYDLRYPYSGPDSVDEDGSLQKWIAETFGPDYVKSVRYIEVVGPVDDETTDAILRCAERLELLCFSPDGISDQELARFAGLPELRVLLLVHCEISDASVETLCSFPKIHSINAMGTKLTAEGAAMIRERRPEIGYVGWSAGAEMPMQEWLEHSKLPRERIPER